MDKRAPLLRSNGEFKILFVTSLRKKLNINGPSLGIFFWILMACPVTRWELAAPSAKLALNSQNSQVALHFLVWQRHFINSIKQVLVIPRADSSFLHFPSTLWPFERNNQTWYSWQGQFNWAQKNSKCNLKSCKIIALRCELEGLNFDCLKIWRSASS